MIGQRRVLIMDDDQPVREVAAELVRHLGYEVAEACHGQAALLLYQAALKEGKPYQAVILDLKVSEGMGGEETMLRLREMDPAAKVIVSSGYSSSAVNRKYRAYGFCASLPKPYRLSELRRIILRVLGSDCG